ncbi:hypothetical protein HGRIS_013751 [Hohenbuehelia grisea]|uniref:Post-GPI attachment to proteins factor 3 n=1 Tax=Hohenbuehelia grisea TaxID=104357 RepID=A0ABR3IWJ9_9AGAR
MRLSPIFFLSALACIAHASSGDRSPVYIECVAKCDLEQCQLHRPTLPLALRLTGWTCRDNCKYNCMHEITQSDVEQGRPVQQYHGKWPFWRLAGMQEPASVAFSMLNLWAHARGFSKVRRRIDNSHPMKSYYIMWSFTSINAWIWSSVFHTRDLPVTEKLDYFSAALAILYALYYVVLRLFHIYPTSRNRLTIPSEPSSGLIHKAWSSICIMLYLGHVSYLALLPRFDYTYNMIFNLAVGLTHNILWVVYSLPFATLRRFPARSKSYRPRFVSKAAIFVALTTAATALELFDFPPWRGSIDVHSLWHLSTVPISLYWYDFLVKDALDEGWRGGHRL